MGAAAVVAAAGGAALTWLWWRDQDRARRWREGLLRGCEPCLQQPRASLDRAGMPVLAGQWDGLPVQLALILDGAGYRKLPVLWLSATCAVRLHPGACFDALARPQGTEFFSPFSELSERLESPPGWPDHVILRADRRALPPEALVDAGAVLFASDTAKELVVSPRGARLVVRVAQAQRPEYLVLRQARFDVDRVELAVVKDLVAALTALAQRLGDPESRG